MSWVKLDDRFWSNRKIRAAGPAATGVYTRCLSWCGAELTDGRIPRHELSFICAGVDDLDDLVERLIEHDLLVVDGDDLVFPDYEEFNPPREKVLAQREADRKRKAKGRATQARTRQSDSDQSPEGTPTDSGKSPAGIQPDAARIPDGVREESSGPDPTRPVPQEKTSETADAATDPPSEPDPVDVELCEHLAAAVEAAHGKRPKQPKRWFNDMRLLRERGPTEWETPESIDPAKIRRLIDWALNDEFWRDNVRSPDALRRHWEKLRSAANEQIAARKADSIDLPRADLEPRSTIADPDATRRMLDEHAAGDHANPVDSVRSVREAVA